MIVLDVGIEIVALGMGGRDTVETVAITAPAPVDVEITITVVTVADKRMSLIEVGIGSIDHRLAVEKFVDDNPDAAAALLRNWLSGDWG